MSDSSACPQTPVAARRQASPGDRTAEAPPLLTWPGWPHLYEALKLSAAVLLLFCAVYGGCDWLTALRHRHHVHLPLELGIPLVPWMVIFYLSLDGLFLLAPFVLRSRRELRALAIMLAVTIVAAGIGFLLLPAELAFPQPTDLGVWHGLFAVADTLNLNYNLVPSLHVALAIVCVDAFAARAAWLGKLLLWAWGGAITASTVFTHQHHLLDVVTGLALAVAASRLIYPRLTRASAIN